jgi:hypothetical protein
VKKLDSTMEKLNFSLGVEVRVVPNTISSSGNHFLTFEKAQSYGNADMVSNDGTKILILEDGWYHVKGPFLAPVPSLVKNNIFALFIYKNGEGGLNRIDGTVLNWGGAETGIPGVGWSSGMTGAGLTRYFKAGDYLRMSLYTMVDSSLTSINNVDEDNMAMASVVRIGGVEIPRVEVYDNSLELYPGLGMTGKVVWGTRSVPTAWSYDGTMVGVAGQASMIQGNKIVVPESGYYMFTAISPGNITPPLPNVPAASSRVLNVVTSSSGFNWYIYTPSEFSNQEVLGGTFFGWFNQGETLTVGLKVELNGYSVSNPWNTSTALPDMKFNFCKVGTLRSDTIEKAKAYWVKVKAPAGAGATTESGNTVPYQFVDGTATMISGGAFVVPRTGFYSFSGGRMKISSSLYDDVVINLYIGDTWDNESTIYDNHFRWGNVKCNTFPSINAMCYLEANQRVKVYYGGTTNTLPAPSFPGVEVEHFITMREML